MRWVGPATTRATARSRCTTPCITTAGRVTIRRATPPIRARVHGLFESQFVDAMKLEGRDFQPRVGAARVLADPFAAILAHLDEAGSYTEQVYQLEKSGALADPANAEARALVIQQTARGAALLRDLAHTAWVRSGEPPVMDPGGNPILPPHPRYNPQTGTAPAPKP